MPTYRLVLEYNGAGFAGWQIQPGRTTVQETVERALAIVLRTPVGVVGSGRTDAGVHARGQVAHFRTRDPIDPFRTVGSLNGLLPESVAVIGLEEVHAAFHARYDAVLRTYVYQATTQPRVLDRHLRWLVRPVPDFDRMNRAAAALEGIKDFDAFCRTASTTQNRVCHVHSARWLAEERAGDWRFVISADRFLHGMVRAIVGTLVEIGRGRRSEDDIERVLISRDRRFAGPAAPPHGLVLESVAYAAPFRPPHREARPQASAEAE